MKKSNNNSKRFIEKIKSQGLTRRPKWHFVLSKALSLIVLIIVGLSAIYLTSFLIYVLRSSGISFLPGFGLAGLIPIIKSFPWTLLVAVGALIIILEYFVSKISLVYKKPLIYSLLIIVAVSVISGYLLAGSQFHPGLMKKAVDRKLPIAGPLYRGFGRMEPNEFLIGEIVEIRENSYILQSDSEERIEVLITSRTHQPPHMQIDVNDRVIVVGEEEGGQIEAEAIRPIGNHSGVKGRMW